MPPTPNPPHLYEEAREGEQDNVGAGCEGQGKCAGGGEQGGVFEKVEEEYEWCGAGSGWNDEEFF